MKWAIEHQGIIFGNQPGKIATSKKMATFLLLQGISRMDYNCLNQPLYWKDSQGKKHMCVYHPMDLLHQVVDKLNISSRCNLYQKLSLCKLAVPVLLKNNNLIYMQKSLHHIKTSWYINNKRKESSVTIAGIPVVSMIRIGEMTERFCSKSKLANDILEIKFDATKGSCGFFTKFSAASNDRRKLAEGNVEGVWYETLNDSGVFGSSFTLLNLRGNAQNHIETSLKLASATDILMLFFDEDMFKDDQHIGYLDNLKQKTRDKNGNPVVKKIIIMFTKACIKKLRQCYSKFVAICPNVIYQLFDGDYQRNLNVIKVEIDKSLKNDMGGAIRCLNERFLEDETLTMESSKIRNKNEYIPFAIIHKRICTHSPSRAPLCRYKK